MAVSEKPELGMLAETPFGRGLSPGDLQKVADISTSVQANAETLLFQEGSHADQLYLVIRGKVGLEICLPRKGCIRILTVGPGEFLGWSAIVGRGDMTTRAKILEPTTLVVLPGEQVKALCESDHDIGYRVMQQVAVGLSQRLLATRLQMLDVFDETQPIRPPDFTSATNAGD